MMIDEIHILPTDKTPEVLLKPEGIIKIKGRGLMVNETEVPKQVMNWIDVYLRNPAEITNIIIAFEYLNSFSTLLVVSILKKLLQVTLQKQKLVMMIMIYWREGNIFH
jgi:hypothetical protein